MIPYFDRLAEDVDRAWSAVGRGVDDFADVAADALASSPPREALDVPALVDAALDPARPTPRQLAPPAAFGQPGLTAHYGDGFVIEVYFWAHSRSAIHDHPFQGAFTVAQGFSVHAEYDFELEAELGPGARLGALGLRRLSVVEPGIVVPFGVRHPLVHALLHVPAPSVSIVVRTIDTEGYYRYFPPSVALTMGPASDAVERALMLLDTLRAANHPSYPARRDAFLGAADFETTFRLFSRVLPSASDEERAHLLERAHDRHGERASCIAPSLERALDGHAAEQLRMQLVDPDDRFVATGLQLADGRARLLSLLGARLADPRAALHRVIDRPGVFAEDEAASVVLARALVDGEDLATARGRLVASFGEAPVAAQDEAIERYWTRSPFACLGRA